MSTKIEWNDEFTEAEVFLRDEIEGTKLNPSELSELGVAVFKAERLGLLRRNVARAKSQANTDEDEERSER